MWPQTLTNFPYELIRAIIGAGPEPRPQRKDQELNYYILRGANVWGPLNKFEAEDSVSNFPGVLLKLTDNEYTSLTATIAEGCYRTRPSIIS